MDIECAVALDALYVNEHAAARVLRVLPNLRNHVCVAPGIETFGEELVGTEVPHLLEHVVIELQGQAHEGGSFTGHTSWAEELAQTRAEGVARMRVTVTFSNDLVALRACALACELIEWALAPSTGTTPDSNAYVTELRGIVRAA